MDKEKVLLTEAELGTALNKLPKEYKFIINRMDPDILRILGVAAGAVSMEAQRKLLSWLKEPCTEHPFIQSVWMVNQDGCADGKYVTQARYHKRHRCPKCMAQIEELLK
jgi:hypothetical protein